MTFTPGIDPRCAECPYRLYCTVSPRTTHCIWCGDVNGIEGTCCVALADVFPYLVRIYDERTDYMVDYIADGVVYLAEDDVPGILVRDLSEMFELTVASWSHYSGEPLWYTRHKYTAATFSGTLWVCLDCFIEGVKRHLNLV